MAFGREFEVGRLHGRGLRPIREQEGAKLVDWFVRLNETKPGITLALHIARLQDRFDETPQAVEFDGSGVSRVLGLVKLVLIEKGVDPLLLEYRPQWPRKKKKLAHWAMKYDEAAIRRSWKVLLNP